MRCRPRLPCETLEHSTPALTLHPRTHTSMQGRQNIEKQLPHKSVRRVHATVYPQSCG